jgi:hypothetical protein
MKSIWPSGECKPILMLKFGVEKAQQNFNINFRGGSDDLDEYEEGLLENKDIGPILFFEYKSPPIPGVTIHVDKTVNSIFAIEAIKSSLNIKDDEVYWSCIDIKKLINDCKSEVEKLLAGPLGNDTFLLEAYKQLLRCEANGYIPVNGNLEALRLLGTAAVRRYNSFDYVLAPKHFVELATELSQQLEI